MLEREKSSLVLEALLEKYNISQLLPFTWSSWVDFSDGIIDGGGTGLFRKEGQQLSLFEAFKLRAEELLKRPAKILDQKEETLVGEKKHGGRRPQREINQIRERYRKMKAVLVSQAPGKVLAAIAENSGRKANWSEKGLMGQQTEWKEPSIEEQTWWQIIYDMKEKRPEIGEAIIENTKLWDISRAVFTMRFRWKNRMIGENELERFNKEISFFIPEDDKTTVWCVSQITRVLAN